MPNPSRVDLEGDLNAQTLARSRIRTTNTLCGTSIAASSLLPEEVVQVKGVKKKHVEATCFDPKKWAEHAAGAADAEVYPDRGPAESGVQSSQCNRCHITGNLN